MLAAAGPAASPRAGAAVPHGRRATWSIWTSFLPSSIV